MEKLTITKRIAELTAVGAGALALAGCVNYSGEGNEFVVSGRVVDPGKHSVKARITEIELSRGTADGWFKIGKVHQLHDNCDCHGFFNSNKKLGTAYDQQGAVISPNEFGIDDCVQFFGKIRANSEGKTHSDRPVYTRAQEVDCEE